MKNKKTKDLAIFALFVFPAVAFVLFATDIPFVMNLYYSVFNWNGIGKNMEFVGLANYVKIFTADPLFCSILCCYRKYRFSHSCYRNGT